MRPGKKEKMCMGNEEHSEKETNIDKRIMLRCPLNCCCRDRSPDVYPFPATMLSLTFPPIPDHLPLPLHLVSETSSFQL